MIITDLEFGLILTLIFALFIKGLKKKEEPEVFFSLDKSMSVGLKGISCILILIAHFYNMYHWNDNHSISWLHFSKITCSHLATYQLMNYKAIDFLVLYISAIIYPFILKKLFYSHWVILIGTFYA